MRYKFTSLFFFEAITEGEGVGGDPHLNFTQTRNCLHGTEGEMVSPQIGGHLLVRFLETK